MNRKGILVLLLSMIMVLSPFGGVFAESEMTEDTAGDASQQETVLETTEDEEVTTVVKETAEEEPTKEEPAKEEPAKKKSVKEESEGEIPVVEITAESVQQEEVAGVKKAVLASSAECMHLNTSLEYVLDENVSYAEISGDDEDHSVIGEAFLVEVCDDCGQEVWREKITTREHNYNSEHVCVDCGHKNACEHTDGTGEEIRYSGTLTYEQIEGNNIYHKAKGDVYEVEYCLACGEALKKVYIGSFDDYHVFGENHTCKECGYKNTCDHPSSSTTYEYGDDVTIEDCGKYHSISGKIFEITSCEVCGEDIEVKEVSAEDQPVLEVHDYDESGICTVCGHNRSANWSADGNYYYENGKKVTGWKLIDEEWYYFNTSSGAKKTGWLKLGDYWYYLDPEEGDYGAYSGAMITEWEKINDKWYYFNPTSGRMKTGWLKLTEPDEYDGTVYSNWYYFDPDGAQLFGWQKIKSIWYYFDEEEEEGNMAYGKYYVAKNKRVYMFDENGKWLENYTKWYSEEWTDEDGNKHTDKYYFVNGKAVKGWYKLSNYWYYFNDLSIMATDCWAKDSKGWCWLESNGHMATDKWLEYKGSWYYIKPDGRMAESSWLKDENGYRWVDASGKNPRDKWFKVDDEWYISDKNGYRLANCWAKDSTATYWMDENGKITRTRWIFDKAAGEWYYMNADGHITVSKWVRDSKDWYLLDKDGHIVKNKWAQDSKGWLYLGEDGRIVKNAWTEDSKGTCWAGSDGYLLKDSWIEYEGNMYYVDGLYRVEGKTIKISGRSYTFDSKGKCLNPPE